MLVCSPREAERLAADAWRAGDDLVVTPIRPDELRLRVERLLEQRARAAAVEGDRAELQRSKRFAFVAAHELIAPLAVVSSAVQTALTASAEARRPRTPCSLPLPRAATGCKR